MRLTVIGGTGLIGSQVARKLKQRLPQLTALCWCGPHGS